MSEAIGLEGAQRNLAGAVGLVSCIYRSGGTGPGYHKPLTSVLYLTAGAWSTEDTRRILMRAGGCVDYVLAARGFEVRVRLAGRQAVVG